MSVVPFERKQEPHLSGTCRCLSCGKEWAQASNPGIYKDFECPYCQLTRGAYVASISRAPGEPVLMCSCGCDTFTVSPKTAMCISCGTEIAVTVHLSD